MRTILDIAISLIMSPQRIRHEYEKAFLAANDGRFFLLDDNPRLFLVMYRYNCLAGLGRFNQ